VCAGKFGLRPHDAALDRFGIVLGARLQTLAQGID